MFTYQQKLLMVGVSGWGMLGWYRGTQDYHYKYNQKIIEYNERIEYNKTHYNSTYIPIKPHKYFVTTITSGAFGLIMYICPFTLILCISKELYRAEINLRNLESDKETEYYNRIF